MKIKFKRLKAVDKSAAFSIICLTATRTTNKQNVAKSIEELLIEDEGDGDGGGKGYGSETRDQGEATVCSSGTEVNEWEQGSLLYVETCKIPKKFNTETQECEVGPDGSPFGCILTTTPVDEDPNAPTGGTPGGTPGSPGSSPQPANSPASITNNMSNPCLNSAYNKVMGNTNTITTSIKSDFGDNKMLTFKQSTSLPSTKYGQTISSSNGNVSSSISVNLNVLGSASQEFVVGAMLHEMMHAHLSATTSLTETEQHHYMAQHVDDFISALKGMFPGLDNNTNDAAAIIFSQLRGSLPDLEYSQLLFNYGMTKDEVNEIGSNYLNNTTGSYCG